MIDNTTLGSEELMFEQLAVLIEDERNSDSIQIADLRLKVLDLFSLGVVPTSSPLPSYGTYDVMEALLVFSITGNWGYQNPMTVTHCLVETHTEADRLNDKYQLELSKTLELTKCRNGKELLLHCLAYDNGLHSIGVALRALLRIRKIAELDQLSYVTNN